MPKPKPRRRTHLGLALHHGLVLGEQLGPEVVDGVALGVVGEAGLEEIANVVVELLRAVVEP